MKTMKMANKNKVILGLSGGVDSTTAALLLKEKGFQVVGVYLDVLGNNEKGINEAKNVAMELGIDFIAKDVSKEFNENVISSFCSEYIIGRTPNPCIICNPTVKFKELIEIANSLDAEYIATGHYARIYYDKKINRFFIKRGASEKKDQSYVLYRLSQDVLSRLILPLGDIENKEETRRLASNGNLLNAQKKDSQEICFIDNKDEDYNSYIMEKGYMPLEGAFIDNKGNLLGKHKGLINYTIGQRKGLGITFGKPVFVTKIDSFNNTVTLGSNDELFAKKVTSKYNFFTINSNKEFPMEYDKMNVTAKIRYSAKPAEAILNFVNENTVNAIFKEPQRAFTPGQSIVFYKDDIVIGGGFIE